MWIRADVWICVVMCGYVWICVVMCGYVWICVDMCGYVWICADMCGYVRIYGYVWICADVCGYVRAQAAAAAGAAAQTSQNGETQVQYKPPERSKRDVQPHNSASAASLNNSRVAPRLPPPWPEYGWFMGGSWVDGWMSPVWYYVWIEYIARRAGE